MKRTRQNNDGLLRQILPSTALVEWSRTQEMGVKNQVALFRECVESVLLPEYCNARNHEPRAFEASSLDRIGPLDAHDFLRALDNQLITTDGSARYWMDKRDATEAFFWEGLKASRPRPITLWAEPVITVGAIARLHFDHGWESAQLRTQPKPWAFDLSASLPHRDGREYILGEVKKTVREIDKLSRQLLGFCDAPPAAEPIKGHPARNAYKKWVRLLKSEAQVLWLIGPEQYAITFRIVRDGGGVRLTKADATTLRCPEPPVY